jgi:hypothetical protein
MDIAVLRGALSMILDRADSGIPPMKNRVRRADLRAKSTSGLENAVPRKQLYILD